MRVPDSKRFWEVTSCRIGASSRFCTTRTAKLSPGTLIESGWKLNCSIVTTSPKIHAGLDEGRPKSTRASAKPAKPHLLRRYIGVPSIKITFVTPLFNPARPMTRYEAKQNGCHRRLRKCLRKSKGWMDGQIDKMDRLSHQVWFSTRGRQF